MRRHFSYPELTRYEAPEVDFRRYARLIIDEELFSEAPLDAGVFEYPAGTRCPEHAHENGIEIYFVLDGQLVSVMGGKEYILNKYDLLYIPKGEVHRLENRGQVQATFLAIHVPPSGEGPKFRKLWNKVR